ncbi:hypothetical protein [Blastopirellula retiformator]|uniref:Uncharacterized protein n=1 Tax=Blastopirellula retiformator TaxID=2527970 RepID=A0A5C5V5U8_9BACT|nr:hypothetical protein [Blastopirellula retiformator]TWT33177.1 hypothetical protein Enr8_30020 [Blastopirellula retiformator]
MRVASLISSVFLFTLLFATTMAQEPLLSPPSGGEQPTAEDLSEIAKIRAALGPEFRVASQAFAADLPASEIAEPKTPAAIDASSPASSIYEQTTKPSVERAIRLAKQAEHDLRILASDPSVSQYSTEELERLTAAAEKCRKLAEELESLTLEARTGRSTQRK